MLGLGNVVADVAGTAPRHFQSGTLQCPSRSPYTIATGTTGGAFFSEIYGATNNATYASVAAAAMAYLARVVLPTGEVPYILDGINCTTEQTALCSAVGGPWPYDTISYVTEGVAAVAVHMKSPDAGRSQ
jgi:hypothetical protein